MSSRNSILTVAALIAAAAFPAVAQDREDDPRESYSYVRVLDGQATLASEGSGPGDEAQVNQPLMTGDRVTVARGARLEIALADRNLLRVGGDSALTLGRIAFSSDRGDRTTRIDLDEGEVVLVVTDEALGDSLPEVRTPQAEVVIHRPGSYRIETRAAGWTEVVVREGYAELVTGDGSTIVREGESAWASADRRGVDLADAGSLDALERWGDDLVRGAESAREAELHVEPDFAYSAAPLADYGSWISVDAGWYWQPRVEVGWRPYWRGRWGWTPSGLTWISSEPWGWLPYHYGSWMVLPGYGWCWRPGHVYAPAWVYWHWSDDWVGWCPTGYYTGWYGHGWGYPGFRWGVYGWAGGGWGSYYDWNFVPTHCLRRHDQHPWMRRGHDLERELGSRVPRGVLTTDTRGLPRGRFADPGVAQEEFLRRARDRHPGDLPDVSDFVARKRDLPPQVIAAVRPDPGSRIRLADDDGTARNLGPRTDAPASGRRSSEGSGQSAGGRGIDRREALPRDDGRLFDAQRRRTGDTPPVASDSGSGRPRTTLPPGTDVDRQAPRATQPRGTDGDRGNGRTVVGTRPPGTDVDRQAPRATQPRGTDSDRGNGRPVVGTRPPGTDVDRQAPRATQPRGTDGDRGNGRPVVGTRPPDSGRLAPGATVEIDASGRLRPVDRGRVVPPSGSGVRLAPTGDRAPRAGSDGATAAESRQGWRGREGWTGAPGSTGSGRALPANPSSRYLPRQDEPVQRVLGGIRRYDGGAPASRVERPGAGAPGAYSAPRAPTPGYTPRTPPSGYTPRTPSSPGYAPGSGRPGYSPRSSSPSSPSRPGTAPAPRPSSPPPAASSGSKAPSRGSSSSSAPRRPGRGSD